MIKVFAIAALISFVFASQIFLSSYPIPIVLNNQTYFPDIPVAVIANEVQTASLESVIPLPHGYIRLKANQVPVFGGGREALKYSNYRLNQLLLFKQDLYQWELGTAISIDPAQNSQRIDLSYSTDLLKVTTPLSNYYIEFPDGSTTFVTSDDGLYLYKLSRIGNITYIELTGCTTKTRYW
jgi:hypothetical protein